MLRALLRTRRASLDCDYEGKLPGMEWTMRGRPKGSVYLCDTLENLDSDGRSAEVAAERGCVELDRR